MSYTEQELVSVARRENNRKRSYLVVNRLQGKHVPVSPGEALRMFHRLADLLIREYEDEKLLLIGFAETATAVGAAAAARLGSLYIQTTREEIEGAEYFYFSEQHSHATEQKLVKDDLDRAAGQVDRVIFIEDEITTGDTIWNIVRLLRQAYPGQLSFSAASLLNGMDKAHQKAYEDREIRLHWLLKICHDDYESRAAGYPGDGIRHECSTEPLSVLPREYRIGGYQNARRLTEGNVYHEACRHMGQEVLERLSLACEKNILVLGTEEFMYPALLLACMLESAGIRVRCHATTRSPIIVSRAQDYPLHERYELRSFYDSRRTTFLYDLSEYDAVLIVTDAADGPDAGLCSLVHALHSCKNHNIHVVRWCGA